MIPVINENCVKILTFVNNFLLEKRNQFKITLSCVSDAFIYLFIYLFIYQYSKTEFIRNLSVYELHFNICMT